ncbi:MAG: MobA/MobL family protein [Oscillospiraceae bacterium]|nr:MobA/MobL family protein [Oscillospiraceae bacterium]
MKTLDVISWNLEIIGRSHGRSSVQLAAYCARSRLYDERNRLTYDYTQRYDLVHHEILLPDHAPKEFYYQGTLWNSVERVERCKNSRLARSVRFSLPRDLARSESIAMARRYVEENFASRGMCADMSIHDKGDGNPHAHVLLTTRSLDESGRWMPKQRRNYFLDEHGNRIYDPIKKCFRLGASVRTNDWDGNKVEEWRESWADTCNREFKRLGLDRVLTNISYVRQGSSRKPTIHLGPRAKALEDRGIRTNRGDINREIVAKNRERERWQHERQHERERGRGRLR